MKRTRARGALYEDQFSERHDAECAVNPRASLVIASTPRSGSHMLGHLLRETGCFGFPLEYANPRNLEHWKASRGWHSDREALERLQHLRVSPQGIFSIKLHYTHARRLGGMRGLEGLFPSPSYVLLSRSDPLRQAVSYSMAQQTGSWIGEIGGGTEPSYSYPDIRDRLIRVVEETAAWRLQLAAWGASFIELTDKAVGSDMRGAVQRIACLVGVEVPDTAIPSTLPTQRQSTELNDEWCARFVHDAKRRDPSLTGYVEPVGRRVGRGVRHAWPRILSLAPFFKR